LSVPTSGLNRDHFKSSRAVLHTRELVDFSNRPSAEEHAARTIASGDRLIFPINVPNTYMKIESFCEHSILFYLLKKSQTGGLIEKDLCLVKG